MALMKSTLIQDEIWPHSESRKIGELFIAGTGHDSGPVDIFESNNPGEPEKLGPDP
jgi:hypothetical protein